MKKILIVLLLLASNFSYAGGWTGFQKISGIVIEGSDTDGVALIMLEGGVHTSLLPTGCTAPYNTLYLNSEKGRAILSLALTARAADKPVRMAFSGCDRHGLQRPVIANVWL